MMAAMIHAEAGGQARRRAATPTPSVPFPACVTKNRSPMLAPSVHEVAVSGRLLLALDLRFNPRPLGFQPLEGVVLRFLQPVLGPGEDSPEWRRYEIRQ